jgi:Spy/CpxP family protein refolding chaperone
MASLLSVAWAGSQQDDGSRHRMHRGHHGMMRGEPDFDRMVEHMSRRLELDETQEQAIRNIVDAAKPEVESLRAQAKANREAMHALDTADADYDVKLQNLAIQNGELVTQLTLLHGRVMAQVNAELTDEQREKFAEGRERMHKRFRHHRQLMETADDTTT